MEVIKNIQISNKRRLSSIENIESIHFKKRKICLPIYEEIHLSQPDSDPDPLHVK